MKVNLYAVMTARHANGDCDGQLVTEDGEVLWPCTSNSPKHLFEDLGATFLGRKMRLELLYPQGFEIHPVHSEKDLPSDVLAAKQAREA